MGFRTGREPAIEQTFLERICNALDYTSYDLAKQIGVPHEELEPLLVPLHRQGDINKDDVWWIIATLVDKRLGQHLAIKSELNKALAKQRVAQAERLAAQRARLPMPLPVRRPPLRSLR